jgi:small GTP-binding protein
MCGKKVVFCGDSNVGKTVLFNSFVAGSFQEDSNPTIAGQQMIYELTIDGKTIELNLFDTAGQERFQSMAKQYFRGADAALLCFTVETIQNIQHWISMLKDQTRECLIFLVLTKSELLSGEQYNVLLQQVENLKTQFGAVNSFFTSAKTMSNIYDLFRAVGKSLLA